MCDATLIRARRGDAGFTFAELAFGMLVFVIVAVVLINHLSVNYTTTRGQRDSVFAYGKAQSILAEIQAYVDRGDAAAAIDLDAMDDGVANRPQLTITRQGTTLVPADHPISGNYQRDVDWVWSRRITVQRFPGLNNRNVRFVTVQVFKKDPSGNDHPLASISSVVNSVGSAFPTTQVYDLYLLAVENIPGWWVFMESIVPFVESAITDLEARNPGLSIRTHWITKASYGRNALYTPYVNVNTASVADTPWAYYYPGRMPSGMASQYYYVPHMMKGRMAADGVATNIYDPDTNPMPYAFADWFNNADRLPRERTFHNQRVAMITQRATDIETAKRNGTPVPPEFVDMSTEPTMRLLLEDMNTSPDNYRNAWIINLHGELLPMPAMRNFSDAAKAPSRLANVRVVTHPEELRTRRDSSAVDAVKLRVYSYTTDMRWVTNRAGYLALPEVTGGVVDAPKLMPTTMPIALEVQDLDLTGSSGVNSVFTGVTIQGVTGGTDRTGAAVAYPTALVNIPPRQSATDLANEMYYEVAYDSVRRSTVFKLYNSPVVAPVVNSGGFNRGVPDDLRNELYGLDYLPGCTESPPSFSRDLASVTDAAPRNTARWIITIPGTVFGSARFINASGSLYNPNADVALTVRTRIWDDTLQHGTGQAFPVAVEPDNLSETYTWWADAATDVPMTERSQFLGDPRHNPYKDLYDVAGTDFQNGYNWYHDSLNNNGENARTDYPALWTSVLANGWRGLLRCDLPRFMEVLRGGLVASGAVYTTMTGFSYYYVGLGNEIGSDSANGYASSIPISLMPWGGASTSWTYINTITWFRSLVRDGYGTWPYWWGITWLGELYPDRMDATWLARGNLPAGNSTNEFVQAHDEITYANGPMRSYGTRLPVAYQVTGAEGCVSFFNIGTTTSTFHHHFWDGTSALVGAGLDLSSRFNFPMPTTAPSNRPFRIDTNFSGGVGSEFSRSPYSANRYVARLAKTYYNHPSGAAGSGLVELRDPANTSSAYIVVNGISNAVASGSSFLAKYSVLTMVQSFLEGTDTTMWHGITQVPRVEIETPTEITELVDPTSVPLRIGVAWRRWDGQTYTSATSNTFTQPESNLDYVVMYSRDNGTTWLICNANAPVTPGQRPTNPAHIEADTGTGPQTFNWSTPVASFPQGTYVLRVECYRRGLRLHYAQHMVRIFINR
jgi:hypothetical protein